MPANRRNNRTVYRAFQLEYGRVGLLFDLIAAFTFVTAQLGAWLLKAWTSLASLVISDAVVASRRSFLHDLGAWSRIMMLSTLVTAYTLLGYEKYLWLRGPYSILPRVLYALGISHAGRPGHGRLVITA